MYSLTLRKVILLVAMVGAFLSAPASATTNLRIVIPRISLNAPLSYTSRELGPQIYYQDSNTLAIAGHRVTHSRPFYYIDSIRKGDVIFITYNGHKNKYLVQKHLIMSPNGISKIRSYPGLILSACTPRHYATYRYVVLAKLAK